MNIVRMLPSEIERLKRADYTQEVVSDILGSIRNLLKTDRGADDATYDSARDLSLAGVWAHIPARKLAEFLSDVPAQSQIAFLEGLPEHYKGLVSFEILRLEGEPEDEEWEEDSGQAMGFAELR